MKALLYVPDVLQQAMRVWCYSCILHLMPFVDAPKDTVHNIMDSILYNYYLDTVCTHSIQIIHSAHRQQRNRYLTIMVFSVLYHCGLVLQILNPDLGM